MIPRLSPRLQAVADLVVPGAPAADIGCDHAQLAAWWVASGRVPRAIASDLRPGPLDGARESLSAAGLEQVELRMGSGLTTLRPGEVTTVALAGMGGPLMLELLEASAPVVHATQRIIVQPNTAWPTVRRYLADRHLELHDEVLTEDAGHTYLTLAFEPATVGTTWNEADVLLGPLLRRHRPPAYERWLASRCEVLADLRERLSAELGPDHPRVEALQRERAQLLQFSSESMNRPT